MNSIISDIYDGKRRRLYSIICKACGLSFYAPKYHKRTYCSHKCQHAARVTHVETKCEQCEKLFFKKLSSFKNSVHGKFFCSRSCKDRAQRLDSKCTAIRPKHYGSSLEYRGRIPLDICVGCGETRRFLLMTHHKDGNRKHNLETNLECVCHNCHVIRHLHLVEGSWIYCTKKLTPRELLSDFNGPVAHLGEREACTFEAAGS